VCGYSTVQLQLQCSYSTVTIINDAFSLEKMEEEERLLSFCASVCVLISMGWAVLINLHYGLGKRKNSTFFCPSRYFNFLLNAEEVRVSENEAQKRCANL